MGMSHDHSKHDTISADDIGETMKAPGSGEDLPDNRLAIGHLEAILRTVSEGYWIIDHRGRIQDANDSLARMLGYSRGELLAKSVSDLEVVETAEVSRRITRIQEQGCARFESQLRRKDGRIIDIEASASYLDADSHQIFAFIRDITEQKQAKRALQKLAHDLGERVKELSCLHGISDLAVIPGITLEEIVAGTVDLIPLAWQYPEITCARIVLEGQEFKTENYVRSPWQQMASILAHGEQIGRVEVGYLEEMPESDEGPVLKDEKALLNTIAQRVGEISESRQGQRRIGQQHRFLENILDSLPHPFYVINTRDLTVELANSAAQADGVAGEITCFALTHGRDLPCDQEEHPCPLREVIRTRQPVVVEHVHIDGDGARRDVEVHGCPVFDLEGNLVQMIEYTLDITERKQAEEAVRESETLLRETGRMAKVGGWELDPKDNSVAWTEEVYRIHEVPSDFQPNLESALSFYAPEDRPILEQAMGRAADTGEPWDLELGFITAKGKHLWVRAIGKAEHEDGELVKLSGTFQDITERKQAEEALRESEMRWRSLTQTSPDHLQMVDTDLLIQFANFASPCLDVE